MLITNTSFGEFNSAAQTAVMNVVHQYVQDVGQFQEFYMGLAGISQYLVGTPLPLLLAFVAAKGLLLRVAALKPEVSVNARHICFCALSGCDQVMHAQEVLLI